jgi:hypothetical protein
MSVALMIEATENNEVLDFTPVATQESFVRFWLPMCKELGLQLIPLSESGLLVTGETVDDVVSELDLLKNAVEQLAGLSQYGNMAERIRAIRDKILATKGNNKVKVWLG